MRNAVASHTHRFLIVILEFDNFSPLISYFSFCETLMVSAI